MNVTAPKDFDDNEEVLYNDISDAELEMWAGAGNFAPTDSKCAGQAFSFIYTSCGFANPCT